MKPIRVLGVMSLLAALGVYATAEACPPVVVRRAVYVAPTYAAPVVASVVQTYAVPVVVPLYTAGYAGQDQGTAALLAEIRQLRAAVQEMQQGGVEFLKGRAPPQPPSMPPANGPAGAVPDSGLLGTHCGACHSGGTAKGGVRMFEAGKRLPLAPEKLGDAIEAVVKGTMPKNKRLTDTEVRAVLAELIK